VQPCSHSSIGPTCEAVFEGIDGSVVANVQMAPRNISADTRSVLGELRAQLCKLVAEDQDAVRRFPSVCVWGQLVCLMSSVLSSWLGVSIGHQIASILRICVRLLQMCTVAT